MTDDLKELADKLLRDPFDSHMRGRYAAALFEAENWPASLEQFRLLARQEPSSAAGLLGAARCHARMDELAEARTDYEKAKQCDRRCELLMADRSREMKRRISCRSQPHAIPGLSISSAWKN
jgi:Flp pilus assembly protein TadD